MTLSKMAFWKSEGKKAKVNNGSGGAKKFFSQLSGAFMLPISVMAVAGLFLGIGAAIAGQNPTGGAHTFGLFIQNFGDPVFGAMPILFTMAMIIAFTDDIGTAVFAGIVGFLVFNGVQTPFIKATGDGSVGTAMFFDIHISDAFAEKAYKAVGSVAGIQSLNTSIFAGIIFGYLAARMYNKFHTITLPSMISFFGGKRFVAFVNIAIAIPLALVFLLIWPFIAVGLGYFGEYSGKVAGLDSFIFGFVERSLIPFGLHHVFYAPLWYTGAGGEILPIINDPNIIFTAVNGHTDWTFTPSNQAPITDLRAGLAAAIQSSGKAALGDSFGWLAVNGSGVNNVTYHFLNDVNSTPHTDKIFMFLDHQGLRLGRFMQGKFAFMQFGLPAAAAAMVMAAPKENRKQALGTVFPAALTSFVTGVTEPIEFTFLFLAPYLFWGFHAVMAAFSFLFMNLLHAHIGMTFSGGFLDAMIYGALPINQGTNFYWYYLIGAAYAPIYYFVFYFCIKKFNIDTPGRGGNTKLFSKADFKAQQAGSSNAKGSLTGQSAAIVAAFGGWDNITSYKNCATRLRYDVKDNTKVSIADLKAAGAVGVVPVGTNHFQAIMGPQAEQINTNIKSNVGVDLGAQAPKDEAHESILHKVEEKIMKAEKAVVTKVTGKTVAKKSSVKKLSKK